MTTKINLIDRAEMVRVLCGTFTMGSPDGVGRENEHPAHQVTLSDYWIYKYPVTVAQYGAFCAITGHALPPFPEPDILDDDEVLESIETIKYEFNYSWEGKSGWDDPTLQQHPIVNVTWYDCKAYADWAGVNLPTEAQWEYAARGPEGRNYPWGGMATSDDKYNGWDESKCANGGNSCDQNISTWPVGSFPAGTSWCGVQDLAGNVWEWCADWYGEDYYKTAIVNNPTGLTSGNRRVLRGGLWYSYGSDNCRGSYRNNFNPYNFNCVNSFGFRCASPGS